MNMECYKAAGITSSFEKVDITNKNHQFTILREHDPFYKLQFKVIFGHIALHLTVSREGDISLCPHCSTQHYWNSSPPMWTNDFFYLYHNSPGVTTTF